jgi:type I restriction enzyme S subunit
MHAMAKLGDVAEFIRGITFKPDDVAHLGADDSIVCMRTKNVQALLDCDDLLAVPSRLVRRKEQYLKEGDILVSSANSWNLVGKCCWVPALPWPAAFGGFISVLRGDSNRLDRRYLYWWFSSARIQRLLRSFGQKTTNISNLNVARCLQLEIPLPNIAEQRRIAAILDKADALRAKRREALAQFDRLAQSIFLEMFGDPATNPRGWKSRQLGEISEVGSSKRVFVEQLVDEGIPFYRGTEVGQLGEGEMVQPTLFISHDHYERLKAEAGVPSKGDLLLPSICPDGRIYTVDTDKPFYFKDARVLWIRVNQSRISSTFLRHYLKLRFVKDYSKIASGTTFAELKIFSLKSLDVQLPPMDLQRRFADAVAVTESQRLAAMSSYGDLSRLFWSLQYRAFRGEL